LIPTGYEEFFEPSDANNEKELARLQRREQILLTSIDRNSRRAKNYEQAKNYTHEARKQLFDLRKKMGVEEGTFYDAYEAIDPSTWAEEQRAAAAATNAQANALRAETNAQNQAAKESQARVDEMKLNQLLTQDQALAKEAQDLKIERAGRKVKGEDGSWETHVPPPGRVEEINARLKEIETDRADLRPRLRAHGWGRTSGSKAPKPTVKSPSDSFEQHIKTGHAILSRDFPKLARVLPNVQQTLASVADTNISVGKITSDLRKKLKDAGVPHGPDQDHFVSVAMEQWYYSVKRKKNKRKS
jgi:chromosome condensin MukBEF ATPase and DNA-binding subunit MukB